MNNCVYCDSDFNKCTEHVFPHGLGGEKIFVDFVCPDCNGLFSGLEAELYQKSIISVERSIQGIEGYSGSSKKQGRLKASSLFVMDEKNSVVYEGVQYAGMETCLLPQIIKVKEKTYIEGEDLDGLNKLRELFSIWVDGNLRAVISTKIKSGSKSKEYYQYRIGRNSEISHQSVLQDIKVKDEIRVDILDKTNHLYSTLSPRLFLDNRNSKKPRLRVRAKDEQLALDFLAEVVKLFKNKTKLFSYSKEQIDSPIIQVGLNFDPKKLNRALVKIGLNSLIHYFPDERCSDSFGSMIDFVNGRGDVSDITISFDKRDPLKDKNEYHSIFFQQGVNNFLIRVGLFGGVFAFNIFIKNLSILREGQYARLLIDYNERKNIFQNKRDYLTSFS